MGGFYRFGLWAYLVAGLGRLMSVGDCASIVVLTSGVLSGLSVALKSEMSATVGLITPANKRSEICVFCILSSEIFFSSMRGTLRR